jgi:hypothetical protein
LNAYGDELNSQGEQRFYVRPIRSTADLSGFKQLYYNPSTFEIVSST